MATAPIGKIQEFQPDSESWTSYVERIKLYFTTNDIANAKRVPVFLSVIGAKGSTGTDGPLIMHGYAQAISSSSAVLTYHACTKVTHVCGYMVHACI